MTNSAGAVTDSYEYDAFGNLLSQTGSTPNNYLYRGEQWDPDLGLYYLRARYYNPVTGRFMTQAPYAGEVHQPASLHRYRYASGNPVNSIDPSGRNDLMEYGKMTLSVVNTTASVYALGQAVSCLYGAEASAIQVVNAGESTANVEKWLGFQLDAATCSATAVLAADGLGIAEDGIGFFAAEGEPLEVGAVETTLPNIAQEAEGAAKSLTPAESIVYGPLNPGPLAQKVANTFRSGTYTANTLSSDTILYRVTSEGGDPLGRYWTSVEPQGPLQSVIDSALEQNWGNTATQVYRANVPAGTVIYDGAAAAQRGLVGGGNQIFIPQVDPSWIIQ